MSGRGKTKGASSPTGPRRSKRRKHEVEGASSPTGSRQSKRRKREDEGASSPTGPRRSKRRKHEVEEFEVKRIVDCKETNDGLRYRVEWNIDGSLSWESVGDLNCQELIQDFKVNKVRKLITNRKLAPSSVGDVPLAFIALLGEPHLTWEFPKNKVAQSAVVQRPLSPQVTLVLDMIDSNFQENAEQGMYGRATVLLVHMISTYSDILPDGIKVKVCGPPKSGDGRTIVDYAVMIIYLSDSTKRTIPALIIEIKREVSADIKRVAVKVLTQALLESVYTMWDSVQHKILVCITDLHTFHVMKVKERGGASLVEVTECSSVTKGMEYDDVFHLLMGSIKHFYEEIA